jgi:hypothetical protein
MAGTALCQREIGGQPLQSSQLQVFDYLNDPHSEINLDVAQTSV